MNRLVYGAIASLFLVLASSSMADEAQPGVHVYRVFYETLDQIDLLREVDLFESNNFEERYVLAVVHDETDLARLRDVGLRIELDPEQSAAVQPAGSFESGLGIPGFPCYLTVEETEALALQFVADHPTLAEWIDIGDSWEKANGLGGYDLMVLKLTNQDIPGPKPKLFITSSIHAREYTPAGLTTRFAELLVAGYDVDADITWILDYTEVHLALQANPDARKQAENGLLWRKNKNENYCSPTSNDRGADLNRNFDFEWGCCNGSSGSECSSTYRGASPASEPEVQAYQAYLRQEFPDQRGPNLADPAPADATGVYLDIHSSGELILWPWGFPGPLGNEAAFETLGRKLAFYNDYLPQRITGLGTFDGTTADFGYGELGIAALAFELGTTFFQSCDFFENNIVPGLIPSLLYSAKVSRTPYMTPAGPDALEPAVEGAAQLPGALVTLTATIDDTRYNQSNGTEPTQIVKRAIYTVDAPPWEASATRFPMNAEDGLFDEVTEAVAAVVDTSALTPGRHTIFVVGQDDAGNEGAVSAVFVDLVDPAADEDSDGTPNGADCAIFDPDLWSAPDAPQLLTISGDQLSWSPPGSPGATTISYEVLRSSEASDFTGASCVGSRLGGLTLEDTTAPISGEVLHYLVRGVNECGTGLGTDSGGEPRAAASCF